MNGNHSPLLSLLVILLACLGAFASPGYKRSQPIAMNPEAETWTNAQRLARGLTPRKPGTLYNPSRVARDAAQASGVTTLAGKMQVRQNGNSIGYIGAISTAGRFFVTTSSTSTDRLSIKPLASSSTSRIQVEIDDSGTPNYLGFFASTLVSDNNLSAPLVRTPSVAYGSSPSYVATNVGYGLSESYIWLHDTSTGELTAQWVNPAPGKTVVDLYFYKDSVSALYGSADPDIGTSYERVRFYVV